LQCQQKYCFKSCLEKLSRDDFLPADKVRRWEVWLNDLKITEKISLPKCIIEGMDNETTRVTFHGFGDASKHAYCAMIYIFCMGENYPLFQSRLVIPFQWQLLAFHDKKCFSLETGSIGI